MNVAEEIIITPLKDELIEDINQTNGYFTVLGKVVPSFQSGKWSFEEILFDETEEIRFPDHRNHFVLV